MSPIRYTLQPLNPAAHLFRVTCTIDSKPSERQVFRLPNWIPGSYMIRDFARHIVSIQARDERGTIKLEKIDKCRWRAPPVQGRLELQYDVYAWDLSVRAAHLDETHGFFNGASVFLLPEGFERSECELQILPASEKVRGGWAVATSLLPIEIDEDGFGHYRAQNYEDLIDHPVEMGTFEQHSFQACGVEHKLVLSGRFQTDAARICADLQRICEYQIRLFGEPAPFDRYVFLVMVVGDGYGGLEHKFSTSLLITRNMLPAPGDNTISDEYLEFLGLCSHEYFHAWNVKRMRPRKLAESSLDREAHTELLWAFEGITSYYDDLVLVRCGLIDAKRYLGVLAKTITRVAQIPGRFRQSVGQSSFDAWTKFYRQDENAPNAIVSYYAKGALVALALDMHLREISDDEKNLDDLMRVLWLARDEANGMEEDAIERVASDLVGDDLSAFFDNAVRGLDDLPLSQLLEQVDVSLEWKPARSEGIANSASASVGLTPLSQGLRIDFSGALPKITHVLAGSAAQRAGLSAGDSVVAFDGLRVSEKSFPDTMRRLQAGDKLEVHAFRRDELMMFSLAPEPARADTANLRIVGKDKQKLSAWLEQKAVL